MAKGRRTRRSQDYLAQYGYPSAKHLRREAKNIARASVPTVRSVQRPYQRQIQSSRDFLAAVQGALAQTSSGVNGAYDQALSQQQAVSDAAQARLAGLGLGVDASGVQAATGAAGDSAAAQLISNAASAKGYAAKLPAIAAGNATVDTAGLRKQMLDALQNRRDQQRQAYFPALQNVQGQALQRASFNQASDQFRQNMALQREQMAQQASQFAQSFGLQQAQFVEGQREFNVSQAQARRDTAWSHRMDIAKFEAETGFNPVTGKSSTSGGQLGNTLSQFSPAELRAQAKLAAPILNPTTKSSTSTTAKSGSGSSTTTTGRVIHQPPAPVQGVPFDVFVAQLTTAGVDPRLAYQMAAGLYQRYSSPESVLAELNTIGRMDGRPPLTLHNAARQLGMHVFDNARMAWASYVSYAQQYGYMNTYPSDRPTPRGH